MIKFKFNKDDVTVDVPPDTPLLWVVREELGATGTKFGCGKGLCGACTVLFNGAPVRSCSLPVVAVGGGKVRTIEGLSEDGNHKVQRAWREVGVPQCGYCQSGQIMSAVALLEGTPKPKDEEIDSAMSGNICRCGTYQRIKKAIKIAAGEVKKESTESVSG